MMRKSYRRPNLGQPRRSVDRNLRVLARKNSNMSIQTVLILCSLTLYSHLGLNKEQQESVSPVGHSIQRAQNQSFRHQPGYSGSKGVMLVGASCTGEKSAHLLEPSRQPAAPLGSEGIIKEQDQDSFKDEYFLVTIFMSTSRARLISLLRTG